MEKNEKLLNEILTELIEFQKMISLMIKDQAQMYYRRKELAEKTGMSISTIGSYTHYGMIPGVKNPDKRQKGKPIFYDKKIIDAWIAEGMPMKRDLIK